MSHGGLKIEDLSPGAGSGAVKGDVLRVDYRGTLTDDPSVEFDKSYDRNPFALTLGAGQVIQGWEQGLLGMKAGGKRKLTIPSDLAYGSQQVGKIPSNATLTFEIEMLDVIPGAAFATIASVAAAKEQAQAPGTKLFTTALLGKRSAGSDDVLRVPSGVSTSYQIWGYDGNDSMSGGDGYDAMLGGEGKDRVSGEGNDDVLYGGGGDDDLSGGGGNDTLMGGSGDDLIDGGGQPDDRAVFSGESGRYRLRWRKGEDSSAPELEVRDTSNGGDGRDTVSGISTLQFSDKALSVASLRPLQSESKVGSVEYFPKIKDFDGNPHGFQDKPDDSIQRAYKYQGNFDVNNDGYSEEVYTNRESSRWATVTRDLVTGEPLYDDNGNGGITRIVGIYVDPLVAEGEANGGRLKNGELAPKRFSALDSQRRFMNDLNIDNLIARAAGDFDKDGFQEVYWKVADGTAYLRSIMHADGNIQYANYQSQEQMEGYLSATNSQSMLPQII